MSEQSPSANGPGQLPAPPFEKDMNSDETEDREKGAAQDDEDRDALPRPSSPRD